jgi:hypothetical protein
LFIYFEKHLVFVNSISCIAIWIFYKMYFQHCYQNVTKMSPWLPVRLNVILSLLLFLLTAIFLR